MNPLNPALNNALISLLFHLSQKKEAQQGAFMNWKKTLTQRKISRWVPLPLLAKSVTSYIWVKPDIEAQISETNLLKSS